MPRIILVVSTIGFILSLLLTACSPSLNVNMAGIQARRLPTSHDLDMNQVVVNDSLAAHRNYRFLLLHATTKGIHAPGFLSRYVPYLTQTLEAIGGFEKVYTPATLSDLQQAIGDYLELYMHTERLGDYDFRLRFRIRDPATGTELLRIEHEAWNWTNLERPLFNPVFNYYMRWADQVKQKQR